MTSDLDAAESLTPTAANSRVEVARILRPGALDADDLGLWHALQTGHPELDRPFFAPEWFGVLDDSDHSVEVAVLAVDGRDVAFFPFHRDGRSIRPPGGRLADFQGWIGPPDLPVDMPAVLQAIGATQWHFNHLLARQAAAARYASERAGSPLADLSDGFEAFLARHRARGAGWVSQIPRKARKLGREVGELRFELSSNDPSVLARLHEWKRAQRQRTRTTDPFDDEWAVRAVERCLDIDEAGFGGVLSALWAGDELVGVHLGLRSRGTLHVWFPAYDIAHESHSPGMVMLHELLRAAAQVGIRRIDFGRGPERYKASLMTDEEPLVEGYVDVRPVGRLVSGAVYGGRRWLRTSGIAARLGGPKRRIRSLARRLRSS